VPTRPSQLILDLATGEPRRRTDAMSNAASADTCSLLWCRGGNCGMWAASWARASALACAMVVRCAPRCDLVLRAPSRRVWRVGVCDRIAFNFK